MAISVEDAEGHLLVYEIQNSHRQIKKIFFEKHSRKFLGTFLEVEWDFLEKIKFLNVKFLKFLKQF